MQLLAGCDRCGLAAMREGLALALRLDKVARESVSHAMAW
jgi:hypothetical protein